MTKASRALLSELWGKSRSSPRKVSYRRQNKLRLERLENRNLLAGTRLDDVPQLSGDVTIQYEVSPDDQFAVYLADAEVDGRVELYRVELSSGEVAKLSDPTRVGDVLSFQISSDSSRVVYRTWELSGREHATDLFSVSLAGGDSIRLNSELQSAHDFQIAPDNRQVIFRAVADDRFELFGAPLNGGETRKLNGPLDASHSVQQGFHISPDSTSVVYRTGRFRGDVYDVYSAPLSGGTASELGEITPVLRKPNYYSDPREIDTVQISADSQTVAYLSATSLITVPLVGGASTLVGDQVQPGFQISSDSQYLVFVEDGELYRAPLQGGDVIKLNGELVEGGEVFPDPQITPDSSHVVYRADQDTDEVAELYSVSIDGGPSVQLNNEPVEGGEVDVHDDWSPDPVFRISPDGQRVLYLSDERSAGDVELFSALVTGGGSTPLSQAPFRARYYSIDYGVPDPRFPTFSPDGQFVIYALESELYRVAVTGGEPQQLNPPLLARGQLTGFRVAPNGGGVLYRAIQETLGAWELFHAPLTDGTATKASGPMTALGSSVGDIVRLTSDGEIAVFQATHDRESPVELYSVVLATGEQARLGEAGAFHLTQDETRVVFYTSAAIYSVPIHGGTPTLLHAAREGWRVARVVLTADDRVVYEVRESEYQRSDVDELYSVPVGGGQPVLLAAQIGIQRGGFRVAPDGQWVAYQAQDVVDGEFNLYSVPTTGGASSQLNGPLTPNGRIRRYRITSDSSHVVYAADQEVYRQIELYSIPIEGGIATRLRGTLEFDGIDSSFVISSDGQHVVFRASIAGVTELYSVPVRGGEPIRLNGTLIEGGLLPFPTGAEVTPQWGPPPLTDGGDVFGFQVTADGQRVVYRADQETDEVKELYSVPITGGEATKLNPPLAEGQEVTADFLLAPDSSAVVLQVSSDGGSTVDLLGVPVGGGEPVMLGESFRISETFGRQILQFTPDGSRVVFVAKGSSQSTTGLLSAAVARGQVTKLDEPRFDGTRDSFVVSADGKRVLYIANQELYVVPTTGGRSLRLEDPGRDALNNSRQLGFAFAGDNDRVLYAAQEDANGERGLYTRSLPAQPDLQVTGLIPEAAGFRVEFNNPIATNGLNLFDAQRAELGDADIVVEGAARGAVKGSFVVDASRQTGRFVTMDGALAPDSYTVRLRSGPDGLRSADGYQLNGDNASLAGGEFVTTFTVSRELPLLGLPDFVRAPGETWDGIPLSLSDGAGIRSGSLQIEFDPALLTITGAAIGPEMPAGAELTVDQSTPGAVILHFNSPTDLPVGEQVLLTLQATIPEEDAANIYGRQQLLAFAEILLTGADGERVAAATDHGVQVVARHGDVTLNGRVNALDASRVGRVAARLDSGFAAAPLIDPRVIADVTGNGRVNAADALRILASSANLDPNQPPDGGDPPPPPPPNPDPPPDDPQGSSTVRLDKPQANAGDVIDFEFSPDGRFAVYVADSLIDNQFELYSVEVATGAARRLSEAASQGSLTDFRFSPDGQRVVYRAEDALGSAGLHSVSLLENGGSRLDEVARIAPLSRLMNFVYSPDGEHVIYRSNEGALLSVPIAGGEATQVEETPITEGVVWEFRIADDDNHIGYVRERRGVAELFVIHQPEGPPVPIPGSGPEFETSPDGAWDVGIVEGNLVSAPRSGGLPIQLNGPLFRNESVSDFLITPDSQFVVYIAAQESRSRAVYRVPIAGGEFTKLGDHFFNPWRLEITPDGSQILFWQSSNLYKVPLSGDTPPEPVSNQLDGRSADFQISPDSQWVALHAKDGAGWNPATVYGIYRIPLAGGAPILLSEPLSSTQEIGEFAITPDGSHVFYVAEQDVAGAKELYGVPAAGGEISTMSLPHVALGDSVTDIQLSSDGRFVVYRADHDIDDVYELYTVSTVTGGRVKLNRPLVTGNVYPDFQISSDSNRVVYRANEGGDVDLYSVWLSGGGSVTLNRPIAERTVQAFQISGDSQRVVYRASLEYSYGTGLFSVPLDGGEVKPLNAVNGAAELFQISPDSSWVVYTDDGLHSVPIVGGESRQLNGPVVRAGSLSEFQIAADSQFVVYKATHDALGRDDIYSVPIAGGDAALLNGPNHSDVRAFQLTPDGSRVVFYNDSLYSVATAGGEIVGLSAAAGARQDFQITPDGKRVVFRSDDERALYSVFVAGGTLTRLSNPEDGEVQPLPLISAHGERVVYLVTDRANEDLREVHENVGDLYSVAITGGSPVKLNSGGDVRFGYELAPDGQSVVYRADQDTEGVIELYATAITGGTSLKINDPLIDGGNVSSQFAIIASGNQVVYLADQDIDEQIGIYRAPPQRPLVVEPLGTIQARSASE